MDLSVSGVNTSTPTVSAKPSTTVKRADSNGENASNAVASDKVSLDSSSAAKTRRSMQIREPRHPQARMLPLQSKKPIARRNKSRI
jgi:hypothetical protein